MLAAAIGGSSVPAFAADTPKGSVLVARTEPDAILIWDATPAVVDLVSAKRGQDAALRTLESDAVAILAERAPQLKASKVSIRIVYQKIGAVNPAYGNATLASVERLATVSAKRDDIVKHAKDYETALTAGNVPSDVTVNVTGKLPPMQ